MVKHAYKFTENQKKDSSYIRKNGRHGAEKKNARKTDEIKGNVQTPLGKGCLYGKREFQGRPTKSSTTTNGERRMKRGKDLRSGWPKYRTTGEGSLI